ncbi:MAG: hypothetical protein ACYDER_20715 [Ktedonobacteraceae bacterium]
MLFDHLKGTQQELTEHVEAACKALDFLRTTDPYETLEPGPLHDRWVQHMNALNTARVWLGMAAESLHEELNYHNDQVIAADRGQLQIIEQSRREYDES